MWSHALHIWCQQFLNFHEGKFYTCIIVMVKLKTVALTVLTHWRYHSLVQTQSLWSLGQLIFPEGRVSSSNKCNRSTLWFLCREMIYIECKCIFMFLHTIQYVSGFTQFFLCETESRPLHVSVSPIQSSEPSLFGFPSSSSATQSPSSVVSVPSSSPSVCCFTTRPATTTKKRWS